MRETPEVPRPLPPSLPHPGEGEERRPATKGDLTRAFKWQDAAVALAILGGFLGGYVHLLSEAKAQTVPLEKRVDTVEVEQKRVRDDVHELQLDVRELYKTVTTGQRSARLEQPPPSPDGGK